MAINDGIGNDVRDPFPGIRLPAGTGAPGSAGDRASETAGPVIGSPVVTAQYGSSQVPANLPRVPVEAGDTSGMSSDQAAQASVISPGPAADYLDTGAGRGSSKVEASARYPWQQKAGG